MSFLGCVENLSLPEILQVIGIGKRSGVLTVIGKKGTGRILLNRGRVVYASSQTCSRLGYVLVQKGIVSLRDLKRVLREQRASGGNKPIGALLLEKGLVSKQDLEPEVRSQILRVFRDILAWEKGVLYFQKEELPEGPVLVHEGLNMDFLLLESSRLADEEEHDVDKELWT